VTKNQAEAALISLSLSLTEPSSPPSQIVTPLATPPPDQSIGAAPNSQVRLPAITHNSTSPAWLVPALLALSSSSQYNDLCMILTEYHFFQPTHDDHDLNTATCTQVLLLLNWYRFNSLA
jgi:hypothetical protein